MKVDSFEEMHDVEARLRSLYDAPVTFDLAAVAAGAQRRADRRRRTRSALTAAGAAMVVGAVATAVVGVTHRDSGLVGSPASAGDARPARLAEPLYGMPDVAPQGAELVGGVTFFSDLGDSPAVAPAMGAQICQGTGRVGRSEVASRTWSFVRNGNDLSGNAADLTLTGWPTGTGPAAMAELVQDKGTCAFVQRQTSLAWPGHAGPDHWLAVSGRSGDTRKVIAATRVGDVLVTVVSTSRSEATAVAMSTHMADTAVRKLRASVLPAAFGKACGAGAPCPPARSKPREAASPQPGRSTNAYALPDVHPTDRAVVGELPVSDGMADPQVPNIPAVMGQQSCQDPRRPGAQPVAGRSWSYGDPGTWTDHPVGTLTLTGWARGTGAAALADLTANRGTCQFVHPLRQQAWAGHPGADHWLATWTDVAETKRVTAVAVCRVGDLLVAASATGADAKLAVHEATAMADHAAAGLRAGDLPAAQGR